MPLDFITTRRWKYMFSVHVRAEGRCLQESRPAAPASPLALVPTCVSHETSRLDRVLSLQKALLSRIGDTRRSQATL
jgi:hypothetical protein